MSLGIRYSLFASFMFGLIYYYVKFLGFLDSQQGFGWRIIFAMPLVTLFMYANRELYLIKRVVEQIRNNPLLIPLVLLTAALSGLQMWLFTWGAFAGRGLPVSLGYFLLPLVMVLVGQIIYRESLTKLQALAVLIAALGVGYAIFITGYLPWETLTVALGYPIYFMLRKKIGTDHLGGFWWDSILALPLCFYFVHDTLSVMASTTQILLVLGFGIMSALGISCYILASKYLTFSMFGLLSYLEPVLLSLVSIVFGETIKPQEWLTYLAIWMAVALLIIDGVMRVYRQP